MFLTLGGGRAYVIETRHVSAFRLADGKQVWSVERQASPDNFPNEKDIFDRPNRGKIVYYDEKIFFAQPRNSPSHTDSPHTMDIYAYSAGDGKLLWQKVGGAWGARPNPLGVFVGARAALDGQAGVSESRRQERRRQHVLGAGSRYR